MSKCLKCGAELPAIGECQRCRASGGATTPRILQKEVQLDRRHERSTPGEEKTVIGAPEGWQPERAPVRPQLRPNLSADALRPEKPTSGGTATPQRPGSVPGGARAQVPPRPPTGINREAVASVARSVLGDLLPRPGPTATGVAAGTAPSPEPTLAAPAPAAPAAANPEVSDWERDPLGLSVNTIVGPSPVGPSPVGPSPTRQAAPALGDEAVPVAETLVRPAPVAPAPSPGHQTIIAPAPSRAVPGSAAAPPRSEAPPAPRAAPMAAGARRPESLSSRMAPAQPQVTADRRSWADPFADLPSPGRGAAPGSALPPEGRGPAPGTEQRQVQTSVGPAPMARPPTPAKGSSPTSGTKAFDLDLEERPPTPPPAWEPKAASVSAAEPRRSTPPSPEPPVIVDPAALRPVVPRRSTRPGMPAAAERVSPSPSADAARVPTRPPGRPAENPVHTAITREVPSAQPPSPPLEGAGPRGGPGSLIPGFAEPPPVLDQEDIPTVLRPKVKLPTGEPLGQDIPTARRDIRIPKDARPTGELPIAEPTSELETPAVAPLEELLRAGAEDEAPEPLHTGDLEPTTDPSNAVTGETSAEVTLAAALPAKLPPPGVAAAREPRPGEVHAEPASLWRRSIAFAVDSTVMGLIAFLYFAAATAIAGKPLQGAEHGALDALVLRMHAIDKLLVPGLVLTLLLAGVYSSVFAFVWEGRTLGRRLVGIRLVDRSGLAPAPTRAAIRGVLSVVSFLLFLGGFWLAFFDRRGQTLHDKLTATYVVRLS